MDYVRFFRSSAGVAILLIFLLTSLAVSTAWPAEQGSFHFKKLNELQRIQPKKPVRIKLKRTVKGEYGWELSGDDAEEILKVDRELRKVLKPSHIQKSRVNADR